MGLRKLRMYRTAAFAIAMTTAIAGLTLPAHSAAPGSGITATGPTRVQFDSADGRTSVIGYLFVPAGSGPFPAVVMLHGRSGLYSTLPGSDVSAASLSNRHRYWARVLANAGYVTLLVDSFAPRGYPSGFARGTYSHRPAAVSDQTVRPLDAYGAAAFLRQRNDVIAERIGLFGWSNGGMSALALVTGVVPAPAVEQGGGAPAQASGSAAGATATAPAMGPIAGAFRAAIAFYPGCVIPACQRAVPTLPLLLLIAAEDDEVSPAPCIRWAEGLGEAAPGLDWHLLPGASHNFDGIALGSRAGPADIAAAIHAEVLVKAFLDKHLRPAPAAGAAGLR